MLRDMKCGILAAAVALTMSASIARAWDSQGHMMVAAIAWKNLNDSSRARASQLLKLNPDYSRWIAGTPPDRTDQIAFVTAATWADAIKSEPGYTSDGNQPPPGPAAAQNIGYADHLQHRYWHYIDVPFSTDRTPLVQPASPNVKTQIALLKAALRSTGASDDVKSYDLVWLEHLIGDVHQPLHATSRFSRDLPEGDQGGNLVALCKRPCRNELHAYWDDLLGKSKDPATAIAAAAKLPVAPTAAAAITDEAKWVKESFEAARQFVYEAPVGPGAGPYHLDAAYRESARAEAQSRIALAGARLAKIIDANLR
jgi:S1/P1 Nuclease